MYITEWLLVGLYGLLWSYVINDSNIEMWCLDVNMRKFEAALTITWPKCVLVQTTHTQINMYVLLTCTCALHDGELKTGDITPRIISLSFSLYWLYGRCRILASFRIKFQASPRIITLSGSCHGCCTHVGNVLLCSLNTRSDRPHSFAKEENLPFSGIKPRFFGLSLVTVMTGLFPVPVHINLLALTNLCLWSVASKGTAFAP